MDLISNDELKSTHTLKENQMISINAGNLILNANSKINKQVLKKDTPKESIWTKTNVIISLVVGLFTIISIISIIFTILN